MILYLITFIILIIIFGSVYLYHKYTRNKQRLRWEQYQIERTQLVFQLSAYTSSYVVKREIQRWVDQDPEGRRNLVHQLALVPIIAAKHPFLWTDNEKEAWALAKEVYLVLFSAKYWGSGIVRQMIMFERWKYSKFGPKEIK